MIRTDPANLRGIVWAASYPKSGNTWVRAFLHALYHAILGDLSEEIDINRINDFAANDREASRFLKYLSGPAHLAGPAEIAAARPNVQADIVRENEGTILVKTHNALANDHGYPLINLGVSAGAIYIVRNPLDVAISLAHFRGVSIEQVIADMSQPGFGFPTNVHHVYFVAGTWSNNVRSWTERPNPVVHVVRYEDLLEDPVGGFASIARHVVMTPTRDQLVQAIDAVSFERLQRAEASNGFQEKPASAERFFRSGRAGEWRKVLTDAQVERIVSDHGDQMRRFGYLPQ